MTGHIDPNAPAGPVGLAPAGGGGRPRVARRPETGAEIVRLFGQLFKFAVVGLGGFLFASAVLYAARRPFGLYGAGLLAYAATATMTWGLNRVWTFDHDDRRPAHRQWALFVVVNTAGFALNWGTYAVLVTFVPLCAERPVFALAAGSAAGALANFTLCRAIVFPAADNAAPAAGRGPAGE